MNTVITQSPTTRPEFIAIPPRGLDPVFSLSRSGYYDLERRGFIRLIRIRKPGNQLGRTLIDCASVRSYLAKLACSQTAGRDASKNAIKAAAANSSTDNAILDTECAEAVKTDEATSTVVDPANLDAAKTTASS